MKNLLTFEMKKFCSVKNAVVVLLALAALMAMVQYNGLRNKSYWGSELSQEDVLVLNEYYRLKTEYTAAQNSSPGEVEALRALKEHQEFYYTQHLFIYQQQLMGKNYTPDRAQDKIELALERDRHLLWGLEEKGYTYLQETPVEVGQRLAANQCLLDQGIAPLTSPYEMTAVNFLYQLLTYPWVLILLITLALLNVDIFSQEVDGGAYKTLYSQPPTRRQVYRAKYLSYGAASLAVLTVLILLAFALVALVNGVGDPRYPIFYYSQSYRGMATVLPAEAPPAAFTFLPWSAYLLRVLPLYLLFALLIIVATGTASLLLQSTANVLNFAIVLLFLDVLMRTIFPVRSSFYLVWPFTASEINGVLLGAFRLSALACLAQQGSAVLALYLVGGAVLQKRNLAGGIQA